MIVQYMYACCGAKVDSYVNSFSDGAAGWTYALVARIATGVVRAAFCSFLIEL